jgi:hypothetical protein
MSPADNVSCFTTEGRWNEDEMGRGKNREKEGKEIRLRKG